MGEGQGLRTNGLECTHQIWSDQSEGRKEDRGALWWLFKRRTWHAGSLSPLRQGPSPQQPRHLPPCRPALPKLAGLHQGAQLTLTSERAPDPPEGTFTLCLFRRNFHQEHGISTGSVSINKMRQVPLSSERGPGIFYPKGNPLLFSFFTYSDRTLLCCAPSAGPVARCRHCAPASLHLHLFPLVLSFFLRMPLAPE